MLYGAGLGPANLTLFSLLSRDELQSASCSVTAIDALIANHTSSCMNQSGAGKRQNSSPFDP